ncbi:MAG: gliding motility-associated C-terminal domain-containing protein [Bacteroidetes bacterium]|nr:gliding motility-associated C-terminal domain-containing protein [Bacteroidota bacterium]
MKQFLPSRLLLILAVISGIFLPKISQADHLAAVDLDVKYIGTGTSDMKYQITLRVYKICEPDYSTIGNYPNGPYTMNLGLFPTDYVSIKGTGVTSTGIQVNQVGPEDTLDQLCGDYKSQNSCRQLANFVKFPGFLRRTYQATFSVPNNVRSPDLTFSWSSCCRNAGVQNITNTGGTPVSGAGIYVECMINNQLKYNNSSPQYTADPIPYICAGRLYNYVNAPIDIDNDSLYTYNLNPKANATPGGNLPYASGYSFSNPIASSPSAYTVNNVTGTATFDPQNTGKYVLAFRTEDRDKLTGALLGYISRDVQVSVLPCPGLADPSIDSIVQSPTGIKKLDATVGNNIIYVCPGSAISFQVNAHVNSANGVIILRPLLSSILPTGLTYTTTGNYGTAATTTFNWTPTVLDYGDHIIAMEALDSGCSSSVPIIPKVYFVFTIRVLGAGLDAGPDLLICPFQTKSIQLSTVNGNPTSNYSWTNLSGAPAQFLSCTNCENPLAKPPYDYDYVVTTDDPKRLCKSSDTVSVRIDTSNAIVTPQDPLVVCRPAYINLISEAKGPAPYLNIPCGLQNPITCAPGSESTADIGFGLNPATDPTNTPFYTSKVFTKYQFIIPKSEILKSGFYSGTIKALAFESLGPINATAGLDYIFVSLACVPFDQFPVPANNASFYSNPELVASKINYSLTGSAWNQIDFDNPYSWDTSQNLLVDICVGPQTVNTNGIDPVAMVPGSAIQKSSSSVNVCTDNAPTVSNFTERPVVRFIYCPTPVLPFQYHWDSGNNLNDSNIQNPRAYVPRSVNYAVYTIGRNGCKVHDSLHIIVPEHHLSLSPLDTTVCQNQPVPMFATGADSYLWYEYDGTNFNDASGTLTCTNCPNPTARTQKPTSYAVVFMNDVHRSAPSNPNYETGCPDTMMNLIRINPLPQVWISNNDTTIKYGKEIPLFAHGAQWYSWTPPGNVSDPNSPAPLAHPVETTNYIVYGMDTNGCVNTDTVQVAVDYRGNLFVPSAFTPNHDGRNDVFKITNLGTRTLMEFRVFNRWGQEVFSTTDRNAGWDGTWHGEDQPIGSYQYIIRIGYPDNMTETYKGDVTLIR